MKKVFIYIFLVLIGLFATCQYSYAQSINQITGRCAGTLLYSKIEVQRLGDINVAPCSGHTFNINGVPFPSGTGTATFLPIWTAANTLSSSPISWTGTAYNLNNTTLDSEFTLDLVPSTTVGRFRVGDCIATLTNCIDLNQATNLLQLNASTAISLTAGVAFATNSNGSISSSSVTGTSFSVGTNFGVTTTNGNVSFNAANSNNNFTVATGTGTSTFTTADFRISQNFSVSSTSDCAGSGTLSGAGTLTVTLASCVIGNASAVILATYNNTGVANILPLSATRISGTQFSLRGDANATFNYWIIDRF